MLMKIKKNILYAILFCSGFVFAEPTALVLSGGGAKGAYEVGVWKAMCEYGVTNEIVTISGTSVGAINAAMFVSIREPNKIANFWKTEIGKIFTLNTNELSSVLNEHIKELDSHLQKEFQSRIDELAKRIGTTPEFISNDEQEQIKKQILLEYSLGVVSNTKEKIIKREYVEGLLDSSVLKNCLLEKIPENWGNVNEHVFATTLGEKKREVFFLNECNHQERIEKICASCSIPVVFTTARIDGQNFVDGGWDEQGGENIPITPVIEKFPKIKKIYVIYLNDKKTLEKRKSLIDKSKYKGVEIIEFIPSRNLLEWFGALNFSAEWAMVLFDLGYKDACKVLENLDYSL